MQFTETQLQSNLTKKVETAEPYQSEYISRQNTVNKWDLTSHIHAKMRTIQQEKTEITYSFQA